MILQSPLAVLRRNSLNFVPTLKPVVPNLLFGGTINFCGTPTILINNNAVYHLTALTHESQNIVTKFCNKKVHPEFIMKNIRTNVKYSEPYHFLFLFGNLTYQVITMIKKKILFSH